MVVLASCGMQRCWSTLLIMMRTARSTPSATTHQTVDMVSPCSMAAPTGTFSPKGKSHTVNNSQHQLWLHFIFCLMDATFVIYHSSQSDCLQFYSKKYPNTSTCQYITSKEGMQVDNAPNYFNTNLKKPLSLLEQCPLWFTKLIRFIYHLSELPEETEEMALSQLVRG